jgi:hypothetical protein
VLHSIGLDDLDESCVCVGGELPVLNGMLNLREKSGFFRKLSLSLAIPVASPALSKYCETISKKLASPCTLKPHRSVGISVLFARAVSIMRLLFGYYVNS